MKGFPPGLKQTLSGSVTGLVASGISELGRHLKEEHQQKHFFAKLSFAGTCTAFSRTKQIGTCQNLAELHLNQQTVHFNTAFSETFQ